MAESFDISKKVYDAEDIRKLLGIGRTKAYEFLDEVYKKQEPFRVIKIGKVYRIPCKPFEKRALKKSDSLKKNWAFFSVGIIIEV
ncbi:hypothetical protein V1226_23010 [Lachnospiraceae bacterium JLR.KK009]